MHTRRQLLERSMAVAGALAGLSLLPQAAQAAWNSAAFEAKNMNDLVKALGVSAPSESKDVTLAGPDIAENGAVVPVRCACTLPGVKRLLVLVEKNPNMLAAIFEVGDSVQPDFNLRVKMSQSSHVMAVAITADNKVLFSQKEIKVTLGGCGG